MASQPSNSRQEKEQTVVAIVVPFRDPELTEQASDAKIRVSKRTRKWTSENIHEFNSDSRTEQLLVFKQYMGDYFLPLVAKKHTQRDLRFVLVVVEQPVDDGKGFNRGKLLNIGFETAVQQRAKWCIFHDVDLLPAEDITELYAEFPLYPIHIGKLFGRYNHNPEYFGGVVSISETHFRATNEFH